MILSIIGFLVVAFLAGALARALVPGNDSMSWVATIGLGAVGSFVGGFLGRLIGHDKSDGFVQGAGFVGSVIGAIIVLILYKKFGKGVASRR